MEQDVLIDSNVYIDLMSSGRDPAQAIFNRYDDMDVVTCGMVQLDVLRGVKEKGPKRRLEAAFKLMQYVPTDNSLWEEATELAWKMDRMGRTIPARDLLIAACALRADALVHTFDHHFILVPNLDVSTDPL